MISKTEAEQLMREYLKATNAGLSLELMQEQTIEKPYGWVFFYQTAEFIRTGDAMKAVAGNAPVIVNKHSKELWFTGTSKPVDYYIEEYEKRFGLGT